ncbi:MAG: SufE family protein [Micrococcales bacterium]
MSLSVPALGIIDEINSVDETDRLELLVEFANSLPDLPERYSNHPDLLERVEECQSPVYLFVEIHDGKVEIYLTAPIEAPTTRAFASILHQSLNKQTVSAVMDFDNDFPEKLGLTALVSPLRMRGIRGMLARIKRQVAEKSA